MRYYYVRCLLGLSLISFSCRNSEIKHIDYLTKVWGDTTTGKNWLNREDYFIIYNSENTSDLDAMSSKAIKPYIDSFSSKYSNYTIALYRESRFADTLYIKTFGDGYYYKALLDEKPYKEMHWWQGHLLTQ